MANGVAAAFEPLSGSTKKPPPQNSSQQTQRYAHWTIQTFKRGGDGKFEQKDQISINRERLYSLAVGNLGMIAVGPEDGTVWSYPKADRSKGWRVLYTNPAGGIAATAIAFRKNEEQLLIGWGNQRISHLEISNGEAILKKELPNAPSTYFVFAPDGAQFAAVAGVQATFFEADKQSFRRGLQLREPGQIQALAFNRDGSQVFTSILVNADPLDDNESTGQGISQVNVHQRFLSKITHNLKILEPVHQICANQPPGDDTLSVILHNAWNEKEIGGEPDDPCPALLEINK